MGNSRYLQKKKNWRSKQNKKKFRQENKIAARVEEDKYVRFKGTNHPGETHRED